MKTVLREDLLKGDANAVTITVGGNELVVPRMILIGLLTIAFNQSHDELHKLECKPVKEVIEGSTLVEVALANLMEELRYWREDCIDPANIICKFLESRGTNT